MRPSSLVSAAAVLKSPVSLAAQLKWLPYATASSHFPDTNFVKSSWLPDGTPTTNLPLCLSRLRFSWGSRQDWIHREIVLRTHNLPADAPLLIEEYDPAFGAVQGNVYVHDRVVPGIELCYLGLPPGSEYLHLKGRHRRWAMGGGPNAGHSPNRRRVDDPI